MSLPAKHWARNSHPRGGGRLAAPRLLASDSRGRWGGQSGQAWGSPLTAGLGGWKVAVAGLKCSEYGPGSPSSPPEWGHGSSRGQASVSPGSPASSGHCDGDGSGGQLVCGFPGTMATTAPAPGPRAFPTVGCPAAGCPRVRGVRHLHKVGGEFADGVSALALRVRGPSSWERQLGRWHLPQRPRASAGKASLLVSVPNPVGLLASARQPSRRAREGPCPDQGSICLVLQNNPHGEFGQTTFPWTWTDLGGPCARRVAQRSRSRSGSPLRPPAQPWSPTAPRC